MVFKSNQHLFALYTPVLPFGALQEKIVLTDLDLVRRIASVLRLESGDLVCIFDEHEYMVIRLESTGKRGIKALDCIIVVRDFLKEPSGPVIDLFIGVCGKSAFESILISSTQLGVRLIAPVITEKSQKEIHGFSALRSKKIMISAAEQSKQFSLPTVLPLSLLSVQPACNSSLIFFDADASLSSADLLNELEKNPQLGLKVFIGPPEGLTDKDRQELLAQGATGYRLTPWILKTEDAVQVALGIIRSFCS